MDQDDKDMHASLDACLLEMNYDLWKGGIVTEDRYREVLAGIVERRRERLGPPEARRTPIPFPPEFASEREQQAKAVATHDPVRTGVHAEMAFCKSSQQTEPPASA